jgi:hypothetical protein
MNQAMVTVFVDDQVKAANDQVQALRSARDRVEHDERLAVLWKLRREGWSLPDALEEVERRSASGGG